MANPIYTSQQTDFVRQFVGSDSELTAAFNGAFSTDVSKAAMRKKRQRMGISKTAKEFRIAWLSLIGEDNEGIERSLRDHPPVDIYEEQKQLAAARRLAKMGQGPVDIAGHEPSEFLRYAPVDIKGESGITCE